MVSAPVFACAVYVVTPPDVPTLVKAFWVKSPRATTALLPDVSEATKPRTLAARPTPYSLLRPEAEE